MKRGASFIVAALLGVLPVIWCAYSALALFGAAFTDDSADQIYHQLHMLELREIFWRWLAVSLMFGISWKYFLRRGADVH